ncbi:PucR family transcriptional regulator [Nocardia arizonensis]|uniref:PucR family transcriptional regulator n=1 Tax=Nocardia arizonensis TaxID=1141647 RepID=UPI0006CF37CB|nr:helix-turn-helix domain-containing protein [Nocardia arizonensis]
MTVDDVSRAASLDDVTLEDVRMLTRQVVGRVTSAYGPATGDVSSGDVTAVTRICLQLAVSMLDGHDIADKTRQLENAAAGWAREGVPIDTVQRAVHDGFALGLDLMVGHAQITDHFVDGTKLAVEILDTMNSAISVGYVRELRTVGGEQHTALHTLTSALLSGHSSATMARECGVEIADAYSVLALAIPPHPEERDPRLDAKLVARRTLRRVLLQLSASRGEPPLALLNADGGTVLVPQTERSDAGLESLIRELSEAARVPITATVVDAAATQIPQAAEQAHELLDMVRRLRCANGLYRFDDMALEYQLTRPGPGREYLGALLDPLDDHPDLLETLRLHIANNLNRQRTARLMHVHTNTIDYRLKRIGALIGFDPTQPSGLWYLRSALVARSYRTA